MIRRARCIAVSLCGPWPHSSLPFRLGWLLALFHVLSAFLIVVQMGIRFAANPNGQLELTYILNILCHLLFRLSVALNCLLIGPVIGAGSVEPAVYGEGRELLRPLPEPVVDLYVDITEIFVPSERVPHLVQSYRELPREALTAAMFTIAPLLIPLAAESLQASALFLPRLESVSLLIVYQLSLWESLYAPIREAIRRKSLSGLARYGSVICVHFSLAYLTYKCAISGAEENRFWSCSV